MMETLSLSKNKKILTLGFVCEFGGKGLKKKDKVKEIDDMKGKGYGFFFFSS